MGISATSITALVENTVEKPGLLAEHGLAFWVERNGRRLLFDTGQGMALRHNAAALGVDLSTADDVILSHGHFDHTGGLFQALPCFSRADMYVHISAFRDRFIQKPDGGARSVRSPIESIEWLRSRVGRVITTRSGFVELGAGVWITGEIPRHNDFEDTGGAFYLDEACTQADGLMDDQAMFLESAEGIVVLLGCAHAGVVNTLEHIRTLTDDARIHAVLGGMHLLHAGERRLEQTVRTLRELDVQRIGLAHCTGFAAMAMLRQELPNRCFHCTAGTRIEFE